MPSKPIFLGHLVLGFLLGLLTFSSAQAMRCQVHKNSDNSKKNSDSLEDSDDTEFAYDDDKENENENEHPIIWAKYYEEKFGIQAFDKIDTKPKTENEWRTLFFSSLLEHYVGETEAIANIWNKTTLTKASEWADEFRTPGQYTWALELASQKKKLSAFN